MNKDELYDATAGIDEKLLNETLNAKKMKKSIPLWKIIVPIAACFAVTAVTAFALMNKKPVNTPPAPDSTTLNSQAPENNEPADNKTMGIFEVAIPEIPAQLQYSEDYESEVFDRYYDEQYQRFSDNQTPVNCYSEFLGKITDSILAETVGENRVCSPVNLYIAMSMLASCTAGDTQKQILDLLGVETEAEAKEIAMKFVRGNYIDDGTCKSLPTNSVWTGDKYTLNREFLDRFADDYYAKVFNGDAADKEYTKALQKWLTDATGGLLENSAEKLFFDPEMALTLVSTLYYSARWDSEFSPEYNTTDVFHSVKGDNECEFMNRKMSGQYYRYDKFSATESELSSRGRMYFILPDEGVTPEEVAISDEFKSFLVNPDYERSSYPIINFSLPKFDVMTDFDLRENLNRLGVTDVFDCTKADLSPVSDDNLFLSEVKHSARVKVDEQGVVGAAFAVEMLCGAGMPLDEINFTLDRPFIFVIKSTTGAILFEGFVNTVE